MQFWFICWKCSFAQVHPLIPRRLFLSECLGHSVFGLVFSFSPSDVLKHVSVPSCKSQAKFLSPLHQCQLHRIDGLDDHVFRQSENSYTHLFFFFFVFFVTHLALCVWTSMHAERKTQRVRQRDDCCVCHVPGLNWSRSTSKTLIRSFACPIQWEEVVRVTVHSHSFVWNRHRCTHLWSWVIRFKRRPSFCRQMTQSPIKGADVGSGK